MLWKCICCANKATLRYLYIPVLLAPSNGQRINYWLHNNGATCFHQQMEPSDRLKIKKTFFIPNYFNYSRFPLCMGTGC